METSRERRNIIQELLKKAPPESKEYLKKGSGHGGAATRFDGKTILNEAGKLEFVNLGERLQSTLKVRKRSAMGLLFTVNEEQMHRS